MITRREAKMTVKESAGLLQQFYGSIFLHDYPVRVIVLKKYKKKLSPFTGESLRRFTTLLVSSTSI